MNKDSSKGTLIRRGKLLLKNVGIGGQGLDTMDKAYEKGYEKLELTSEATWITNLAYRNS